MSYLFYDTETTGADTTVDQISISTPHVPEVTD